MAVLKFKVANIEDRRQMLKMAEENLSLKDSESSREPPYQTASADSFTRERVSIYFISYLVVRMSYST